MKKLCLLFPCIFAACSSGSVSYTETEKASTYDAIRASTWKMNNGSTSASVQNQKMRDILDSQNFSEMTEVETGANWTLFYTTEYRDAEVTSTLNIAEETSLAYTTFGYWEDYNHYLKTVSREFFAIARDKNVLYSRNEAAALPWTEMWSSYTFSGDTVAEVGTLVLADVPVTFDRGLAAGKAKFSFGADYKKPQLELTFGGANPFTVLMKPVDHIITLNGVPVFGHQSLGYTIASSGGPDYEASGEYLLNANGVDASDAVYEIVMRGAFAGRRQ